MQELWTDNLAERFSGFVREAESEILILSPFIKVHALKSILRGLSQKKVGVITRWRTSDVVSGVCDLAIFEILSDRRIPLMVHPQLHMKGIVRDGREILVATANITAAGLGISPKSNIECATVLSMQAKDRDWIAQIQRESIWVTPIQFEKFRAHLEQQQPQTESEVEEFSFSVEPYDTGFSVLELPSIETPQQLVEKLHALENERGFHEWGRIVQDAATFGLPRSVVSPATALLLLRRNFFAKPIIRALIQFVASKRYFGEVKRWIRQECYDANTLTNAELVQRVQSVFTWIVELSDGGFILRRPHFSECLARVQGK